MELQPRGIRFETPDRLVPPLSGEKEIALWVITVGAVAAAAIFGNYILSILIFVGMFTLLISAKIPPKTVMCEITGDGIKIDSIMFPYETLKKFGIDEQTITGVPKLILHSKKKLMPYIFINLPDIDVNTVRHTVNYFLAEDRAMKEPISYKIFEYIGF